MKKAKSTNVSTFILQSKVYSYFLNYNYSLNELNELLKRFKLPKCKKKKKEELRHFCTNMLFLTSNITKIQKLWRKYFIFLFNKTLGPSYRNNSLSNNIDDFLTTEKICEIDYYYYFSFKDKDNFIYIITVFKFEIFAKSI